MKQYESDLYVCCAPLLDSPSYAKHGRMAVNMPLANSNIFGPESWTNSLIQSMAVNWINAFVDCAWFIRMLHMSDIFVLLGSLLIALRNSDRSVSHLLEKCNWTPNHIKIDSFNSFFYTYVVWISTHWSSSIWKSPSRISGKYVIILISGTAFNTDIQEMMNCREKEFFV